MKLLLVIAFVILAHFHLVASHPAAQGHSSNDNNNNNKEKQAYVEVFDDVESQLSIYPTDTEETEGLVGQNAIFSDFCIKTRDVVMGDIKRTTTNLATNVFSIFYNSFERLGLNKIAGGINQDHHQQQQRQQQWQGDAEPMDVDADDSAINEMLRKQADRQQPSAGFFGAVMRVLSSARDVVATSVVQTLNTIKSSVGLGSVSMALKNACAKVTAYELDMRSRFDAAKAELVEAGMGLAYQSTTVEQLGCVTPDRVLRISDFCRMVKLAQDPLSKMMSFAGAGN